MWTRTYGGEGFEKAFSVQPTYDGGYFIGGSSQSFGAGGHDAYLVKTDEMGDTLWTKTYGGADNDRAFSMQLCNDGGVILAGATDSYGAGDFDFYLVRTDVSGDTLWTRTFGGEGIDVAKAVWQTTDGGFIAAGGTQSPEAEHLDCFIVRVDSAGELLWTRTIGGDYKDYARSVVQDQDGGYVLAGSTDSFSNGQNDAWLLKLQGELMDCCDVDMTPDDDPVMIPPGGRFGLTGYIGNPTSDPIATDVWGGVLYQENFYQQFAFNNITLEPGESMTAHTWQNVPGYAPQGTYLYIAYCGDRPDTKCDSAEFPFTVNGARLEGGADDWSIEDGFFISNLDLPSEYGLIGSYPNPFNANTSIEYRLPESGHVSLEIFNLLGQRITTLIDSEFEAGRHTVKWDASNYSSGIYFYKLTAGDNVYTKRMTLLK
ncbi:MAG: T9SS type A sorting domain-containing protein [candidate division Zixibacteria bacterium]|nr:T9SS type A sorting domain-containing protein [candidate division Zixibacteria bacterium]